MSGNPKFFYGGDSSPHFKQKKECSYGCAGIYNAPVALPLLAELFDIHDSLEKLEDFVATFGANFYSLPLNKEIIRMTKEAWVVPEEYDGIVLFMVSKTINWQLI